MPSSSALPWQETHNSAYRMAKGWRILFYVLLPPLLLLFLVLPFVLLKGKNPSVVAAVAFGGMCLGIVRVLLHALLDAVRGVLIIGPREVTQVGAFKTKTLGLHEILGYRLDDKHVSISPKDGGQPAIKISGSTERYPEIIQWLSVRYPDLNHTEAEQATTVLLADEALGATPEARATALDRARQVAAVLNIAGGLVGAWLIFHPEPYPWAVAAGLLLPALTMAALWLLPNTLRIDEEKNSGYPSALVGFLAPSMALLVRALFDYEVVSYALLWAVAGKAAAGVALLLGIGSRKFLVQQGALTRTVFAVGLLAALYGYSAASVINTVYDEATAEAYTPKVVSKHTSKGKTTTYYLTLEAWGPMPTGEDVPVSHAYYEQVQPGQSVKVALGSGRLGVPWFIVVEE
jgi:hypothetical protein